MCEAIEAERPTEPDLQGIDEDRLVAYLEQRGYRIERVEKPVDLMEELPFPCEGEWRGSDCYMEFFSDNGDLVCSFRTPVDEEAKTAVEIIDEMARQRIARGALDDEVRKRMEVIDG